MTSNEPLVPVDPLGIAECVETAHRLASRLDGTDGARLEASVLHLDDRFDAPILEAAARQLVCTATSAAFEPADLVADALDLGRPRTAWTPWRHALAINRAAFAASDGVEATAEVLARWFAPEFLRRTVAVAERTGGIGTSADLAALRRAIEIAEASS